MNMKTLVTGATGFIGSAVARELLKRGDEVRVLVRKTADTSNISDLDVEIVHGDLLEYKSLAAALKGCGRLYHVGAYYSLWVRDPDLMHAINVDGTRDIMTAALDAGVEKIVYTSTVGAIGKPMQGDTADETCEIEEDDLVGPYKRTKYLHKQQ